MKRVALFASCDSFEKFFGGMFGLDRDRYVSGYRNDFLWDCAAGLNRRGHSVSIYVLSYGKSERRRVADGLSVRFVHLPLWLRPVDSVLYRLRNLPHGTTLRDHVAFAAFRRELHGALREDEIELLYVQEFWTDRFDFLVRDIATIPVLGVDQGALYRQGTDATKRASFARAYKLVCQSTPQLDKVRQLGANAVLITNGVDVEFYAPAGEGRAAPRTILAVGRLADAQKRFSDLLRAMPSLPDFSLDIVGSGPDGAMLQALSRELGVADQVRFIGFVSDKQKLRTMYQNCGVFVSASAREAMALVMLEAMSCGAAVVGTRIGTFEDLLTDGINGRLVPVGAPGELAQVIRDAYERRATLGENARRTVVEHYAADVTYGRLSEVIEAA